jgi:hypothetical protein
MFLQFWLLEVQDMVQRELSSGEASLSSWLANYHFFIVSLCGLSFVLQGVPFPLFIKTPILSD